MSAKHFDVVFTGNHIDQFSKKDIRKNLHQMLKTDDAHQIDRFFEGESVLIKSDINLNKAYKIVDAFGRAGLICDICMSEADDLDDIDEEIPARSGPVIVNFCWEDISPVTPFMCTRLSIENKQLNFHRTQFTSVSIEQIQCIAIMTDPAEEKEKILFVIKNEPRPFSVDIDRILQCQNIPEQAPLDKARALLKYMLVHHPKIATDSDTIAFIAEKTNDPAKRPIRYMAHACIQAMVDNHCFSADS